MYRQRNRRVCTGRETGSVLAAWRFPLGQVCQSCGSVPWQPPCWARPARCRALGSMTELQLKELSHSGLYRRRRDRPGSFRVNGAREEAPR